MVVQNTIQQQCKDRLNMIKHVVVGISVASLFVASKKIQGLSKCHCFGAQPHQGFGGRQTVPVGVSAAWPKLFWFKLAMRKWDFSILEVLEKYDVVQKDIFVHVLG